MTYNTAEYRNINEEITEKMRKHKREKNAENIIEEKRSLKVLRRKNVMGKKEIMINNRKFLQTIILNTKQGPISLKC